MKQTPAQRKRQTLGPVPVTKVDLDPLDIGDKDPKTPAVGNVAGISGDMLRSFIERIERLNEERAALSADIKEVRAEAKGTGFDVKVIAHIIKIRKADKDDLDEFESVLDTYKRALGMAP